MPAAVTPNHSSTMSTSLIAPLTARTGTRVHVAVVVRAKHAGAAVGISTEQPATVFVVQNNLVVGRYDGAVAGTGYGGTSTAGSFTIGGSVLLSGCPTGSVDPSAPDATRVALPAGQYFLIAEIADFTLQPSGRGTLLTPMTAINVTT